MMLTDFYRFKKEPETITKQRIDCTLSTRSYKPFEAMRFAKTYRRTAKQDEYNISDLFYYFVDMGRAIIKITSYLIYK
jgi:hypothetical protein